MAKISIVMNLDTRVGWLGEFTKIGMHGEGALAGCRSVDFMTYGLDNKRAFFAGEHELEFIIYIDEHEPLPREILLAIASRLRDDDVLISKPHEKVGQRWFDMFAIDALKHVTGDYVVHFDADVAVFKRPDFDIINWYLDLLDTEAVKFICQPTVNPEHGYYWASTRFFITKREFVEPDELLKCMDNFYLYYKYGDKPYFPCCLEQTLGIMAWDQVLYPPANWDEYMVFSWVSYKKGMLERLNKMTYDEVKHYIFDICGGIHGPNDVLGA